MIILLHLRNLYLRITANDRPKLMEQKLILRKMSSPKVVALAEAK